MNSSPERGPVDSVTPSWRARRLDPDHSLGLRLTVAVTAAFLVLVPFSLLALLVLATWSPLYELDRTVADALYDHAVAHPAWVSMMSWWTDFFAPMPLRVGALVLVIWLAQRGAPRLALWVAVTMVAGGLLGVLLKLLVGRHRPDLLDPVATAVGFSFPSGHTLNATLAAGVLLLVFLPYTRARPAARWMLWLAAVLLAVVTGISRIALGVHWASDVLGGWLLGTAVVAATAAAFSTWRHHVGRPRTLTVREGVEPEIAEDPSPSVAGPDRDRRS